MNEPRPSERGYSKHMMHEYILLSYRCIVALYLHDYCTTLPYTTLTISILNGSIFGLYHLYTYDVLYLAIESVFYMLRLSAKVLLTIYFINDI